MTDHLWNTIFHPHLAMRQLADEKPWGSGLILYLGAVSFMMIINQGTLALKPIEAFPWQHMWLLGLIGIIFSLLILLVSAGFFSLFSEIIYKRGNSLGLLTALSFAILPGLLGTVLNYGFVIMGMAWLGAIFSSLGVIWVLILQIMAIRAAMDLRTSQALLLYFTPLLIITFITVLFIAFALLSSLALL